MIGKILSLLFFSFYDRISIYPLVKDQVELRFSNHQTYENAGVDFTDISVVFNFDNNVEDIVEMIEKESPEGTVFLHYGGSESDVFEGLTCQMRLMVNSPSGIIRNTYLNVYQK